jgi:hypothetical protein
MMHTLWITVALLLPQEPGQRQEGSPVPAAARTEDERVALEAHAIHQAVDAWTAAHPLLKTTDTGGGRLRLASDFGAAEVKEAVKRTEGLLARLDRALGAPDQPEDARLTGFLIRDPAVYAELCALIARTAPSQADFMERSEDTAGFTLYAPPLTAYFADPRSQEEARSDHSLAHSIVHLEMWRRYGALPLWLTEGIACAGEDGAWGEVWAYWYRDGFVAASSHGDWRGQQTQKIVAKQKDLRGLFAYPARPFEEERALLAFAFATYGLDAEPEAFGAFLTALQSAYQTGQPQGGRPQLDAEMVEALLQRTFGGDFLKRFQVWWKKPPKWHAQRR